uniref:F-box domain-containing protein n=1 Tax=Mycena chlorophos TaxID=658473 RepID=A0ABQ0L362_MYCCL|nr:predicted protein [Mycena chlorophos]
MSLPDEVLSLILTPLLLVPDEKFADTSSESPFSHSFHVSNLLLVSKSWLRVSTPLLYAVVVLRSKQQARALEATLKLNVCLGQFVKKLRLEGGYGLAMKAILGRIPNLHTLFLSLDIWTYDSVAGLCQGLSLVNPRRLVLYDEDMADFEIARTMDTDASSRLAAKIASCISKWDNLRVVELPWFGDWHEDDTERALIPICNALSTSSHVEKIVIPHFIYDNRAQPPEYLPLLLSNRSIRHLHLKGALCRKEIIMLDIWLRMRPPPTVNVTFDSSPAVPELKALDSHYVPLHSAPEDVQDKIWGRILYFAMEVNVLDSAATLLPHQIPVHVADDDSVVRHAYDRAADPSFAIVSKRFQRLTKPLLFRHIVLDCQGQMQQFCPSLMPRDPEAHLALASHVRSLILERAFPRETDADNVKHAFDQLLDASLNVLTMTLFNLVVFGGNGQFMAGIRPCQPFRRAEHAGRDTRLELPWNYFVKLATASGRTLERFYSIEITGVPDNIATPFVWGDDEWPSLPGALLALETLSVGQAHPSFFELMSILGLPALSRVFLEETMLVAAEPFLEQHGSKLTELMVQANDADEIDVLALCPKLTCLTLQLLPGYRRDIHLNLKYNSRLVRGARRHDYLQSIFLDIMLDSFAATQSGIKLINDIGQIKVDGLLPSLTSIQLCGAYWDTSERYIAGEKLVPVADKLWDKGIKILDSCGRCWVPRLSSKQKR